MMILVLLWSSGYSHWICCRSIWVDKLSCICFVFLYMWNHCNVKLLQHLKDSCIKLESECMKDIDGRNHFSELIVSSKRLPIVYEPQKVIEFLCTQNQVDSFLQFHIALQIFLMLSLDVSCWENSFSKFRLIKTYLSSMMAQKMLIHFNRVWNLQKVGSQRTYGQIRKAKSFQLQPLIACWSLWQNIYNFKITFLFKRVRNCIFEHTASYADISK